MRFELQNLQKECSQLESLLTQAENAFKASTESDRANIARELTRLSELIMKTQASILAKRRKCVDMEADIYGGEAHIYFSELLDFLHSGRRALSPANLANSLAGLPDMRWRQSAARCSKMDKQEHPQLAYAVFLAIEHLCNHLTSTSGESLTDSFQTALSKLPVADKRNFICEKWRDFKFAIKQVYDAKHETGSIPYALTFTFLRNVNRQKTSVNLILDTQERLVLKMKPTPKGKQGVK
jgi:hypothetical protein